MRVGAHAAMSALCAGERALIAVERERKRFEWILCYTSASRTDRGGVRAHLNVRPCLRTQSAAVHVHGDHLPLIAVHASHAFQQLDRRLLRLHAMQAHVAPQLDGERELRLEDRELVREGDGERGELPFLGCLLSVGGEGRGARRGVGDPAGAVDPDFAEHGIWEGGEVLAEVG